MAKTIHVKPAPGQRVRDPADGAVLPDHGRTVEDGPYWRRRKADREIEETTPEAIAAGQAAAAAASAEAARQRDGHPTAPAPVAKKAPKE